MSGRMLAPEPVSAPPVRLPEKEPQRTFGRERVTGREATSEVSSQAGLPELHLAELEVHGGPTIFDEDTARGLVTHWLLRELAPMLGIDPSRIEVHVDAEAESRNNARQTTGLLEGGTLYIHPRGFDPTTKAGRSLLAHETVHAAQRQIAAPVIQHPERAHAAAEREAADLARAFAERVTVMRPRSSLPMLVTAAAEDAPVPSLSESVGVGRAREMAAIHSALSGLWISDGDVFKVMRILDTMPFAVARQLVMLLDYDDAFGLADNINPPHLGPHTRSVIATYSALAAFGKDEFLKTLDLDVFAEGSWGEMDREVKQAARELIALLSVQQRQTLLRSENRLDIKLLTQSAEMLPEQEKERKESEQKVLKAEADLAEGRKEIAALEKNDDANAVLKSVREALGEPVGDESGSAAQRALDALQILAPYRKTPTLPYVAEKLDADGLVDTILETLPDTYFFDEPGHTDTLVGLVQARLPSKNIDMVVDMLSYGVFDLAVRDYEAKFAYRILSAMPLADQYRFRQREGGKYFLRLASNLPKEVKQAVGYREIEVHKASAEELGRIKTQFKPGKNGKIDPGVIDEQEQLYDAGRLYAEKRVEASTTLVGLLTRFAAAEDNGWEDEAKTEQLFQEVAAVGGAGFNKAGAFTAKDQVLLETIVHELDSREYIEKLFKALRNEFLFSEANRIATVKIMMSRDPVRAAAHARDLVSHGFLDWMVTEREAYLAFLCVKALPDAERAALIQNDAWAWKRIQSELSEDMRKSRDLNLYVGDAAGKDRASVLGQLAEISTWTEANAATLDGLLRMAIAMTEHRFAYERSQQFKAYEAGKPALNALVTKYKLAPNATQAWTPEVLKGSKWYEGIVQTLRSLWKGLVFLWNNDLLLVKRSVGFKNLNLNELQDVAGGDLGGIRLADPKKPKDPNQAANPDANKLTLLVDVGAHALTLKLPDLIIDSVNFLSPGGKMEAGSLRLRDLTIKASYDSEDMNQPTSARLDVGSFEIVDLLMAMRDKMVTVSRFLLSTLHMGAGTKDTTTASTAVPRGGYYFPIPFLATIGTIIYYLFKFKGWGPETPTREMKHGAEQVRALDLTFANLEIQGLTTSGGQTLGNLKIADFALRIGMNKTTLLRAQIASLGNRIQRKNSQKDEKGANELLAQQQSAQGELKKLEADENWMLAAQQRILHDKLTPDESKRLQDTINAMKFEAQGGQFLDIGSIDASGISGGVTVKSPIHMEGLHGEGRTNEMAGGLGIGIVTDAKLIEQMAQGSKVETPYSERGGEFRLDVDKFYAEGVSVGGGQVRSASDIQAKLDELKKDKDKPEFASFYEELQNDLLPKAQLYEQYLQIGVSALNETQLKDFTKLRAVLAKAPSIVFGSIDLVRAHLDVNLTTGGIGLGADQATLTKVSMPEKGLSADEIKIKDIKASASVDNGLAGWVDWKKNLSGGGLHAGSVEVSGARDRNTGLLFKKATLMGGGADVRNHGDTATAEFDSLTIEGLGLGPRLNLMRRRSAALEQNRKPSAQERKERDRLRKDVPALASLSDKRTQAVAAVNKAKTAEERQAATLYLEEIDAGIAASLAGYGSAHLQLDDFGIRATGAGNVLNEVLDGGFDKSKVLKRGVTIEGTGKDHQVLGHASFGYRSPLPDDARLGKTDVELGPVKLNATVKQDELTNFMTVDVAQMDMDTISLSEMMLTGFDKAQGGAKIWSSGRSTLNGLKFSGSLLFAPATTAEGDYQLASIDIRKFDIDSLEAQGLGYENTELKVEARARSGRVHGIHAGGMKIDLPQDPNGDAQIFGKARIESISNADIAAALPGGMELGHGLLNARELSIDFLEGGGKKLTAGDLSLTAAEFRGPDGWARFSLEHLSGAITMDKNGYKLQNVKLEKLTVPSLDWKAGETGRITADQPVELIGLSVDGRIDMKEVDASARKGDTKKPKKESKLLGVHIDTFRLDSIAAKHLTYKDGDTVIDVGLPAAADKDIPKFMQKFRPFFIENFTIQGLDWSKEKGLKSGEINVESYGAAVVYQDLGKHLKAGGSLKGAGMHASFTGPNTGTATLGKIGTAMGFLKNKDLSTAFGASDIMESFTFGDNFIEMNNLEVSNIPIGKTVYGAGTPQTVVLGSGWIDKITVSKVHVDYEKTKEDGKDATKITAIKVPEVKFLGVTARNFDYGGTSEETVEGKQVTKTKAIHANSAHIEQFRLINIDHDPAKALTTLGIRLEENPAKKKYPGARASAFYVSGLTGEFINKFSDGNTVAKFAASLDSGTMSADNIQLQTVKSDDGSGKTRTTVAGTFALSRFGLNSITGSYTDKKGTETTLGGLYGQGAALEFEGISPTIDADGTLRVSNINAQATNFQIHRGKNMTASIPLLDIKNLALGMRGMGTEAGIRDFGLRLGELSVKGLYINLTMKKHWRTEAEADEERANPAPKLSAAPLSGLNGDVTLDLPVIPNERISFTRGSLRFINAKPYNIGVDKEGMYLEARERITGWNLHRFHFLEMKKIPGAQPGTKGWGGIDIRKFVEGKVNEAPEVWDMHAPEPEATGSLNHLGIETGPRGLSLGEGKIGFFLDEANKSGELGLDDFYLDLKNDNAGNNIIHIPKSNVGNDLKVLMPQLHAQQIVFPGGKTGKADFDLAISVQGMATLTTEVTITARSGKIADIQYGDLTVVPEQKKPTQKGAGSQ